MTDKDEFIDEIARDIVLDLLSDGVEYIVVAELLDDLEYDVDDYGIPVHDAVNDLLDLLAQRLDDE